MIIYSELFAYDHGRLVVRKKKSTTEDVQALKAQGYVRGDWRANKYYVEYTMHDEDYRPATESWERAGKPNNVFNN